MIINYLHTETAYYFYILLEAFVLCGGIKLDKMNTLIWATKSLYKMLIILMLLELMQLPQDWWYDTLMIGGFAASVFSSIPYSKNAMD